MSASLVVAWEASRWSPRSAARRNDLDADERRPMLGPIRRRTRRAMHGER
jgi:hypothetical protein